MNFKQLYNKSCCVMQWSIGLANGDIKEVIRNRKCDLSFKWIALPDAVKSIADPFLLKDPGGNLNLLYEDFSMTDEAKYGRIVLAALDKNLNVSGDTEILDTKSHSSYPFVFVDNGKTYVLPETSQLGKLSAYEYDFKNRRLVNETVIMNQPLLDSTLFKYNNKYWLFATLNSHGFGYSRLHIYYADNLLGPYQPHPNNPVTDNPDGSRPAGNIIEVDGAIYRPAQNCSRYYGESITINKITSLSETAFSEEFYFKITPDINGGFNAGVHTINVWDDTIVIDGIKMLFRPVTKFRLFLKKKLKK